MKKKKKKKLKREKKKEKKRERKKHFYIQIDKFSCRFLDIMKTECGIAARAR
jgi:hypothetical protein